MENIYAGAVLKNHFKKRVGTLLMVMVPGDADGITMISHVFLFCCSNELDTLFRGRLKYYTHPPELMSHVSAEVVQTMAREFSLDDSEFNAMETEDLEALPQVRPSQTVRVESNGIVDNVKEGDTDEELDDDDDDSDDIVSLSYQTNLLFQQDSLNNVLHCVHGDGAVKQCPLSPITYKDNFLNHIDLP